jgi:ABC-type glycerol-3-phosphate transport system substrate-binding protein
MDVYLFVPSHQEKNTMMMKKTAGVLAGTLVLTIAGIGSASAAPADDPGPIYTGCSTEGAAASMVIQGWTDPGAKVDVQMEVNDTAKDGRHAAARVVTHTNSGKTKYWPWHANYKGQSTKLFDLVGYDDEGLWDIGIEVASFNGDTKLYSCTDWALVGSA